MAITDNLISHWTLDEASDGSGAVTRNDSWGTNHLTDINTVASATGKIGNAASFVPANLEYLSVASNSTLQTGDIDFEAQAWFYLDAKTGLQRVICGRWSSAGAGNREYILFYNVGTDRFNFVVSSNGGATTSSVSANNFGAPATGTWYMVNAWHDAANNLIGISVNAGTPNTTSWSSGVAAGKTAAFVVGVQGVSNDHSLSQFNPYNVNSLKFVGNTYSGPANYDWGGSWKTWSQWRALGQE